MFPVRNLSILVLFNCKINTSLDNKRVSIFENIFLFGSPNYPFDLQIEIVDLGKLVDSHNSVLIQIFGVINLKTIDQIKSIILAYATSKFFYSFDILQIDSCVFWSTCRYNKKIPIKINFDS
ncbi:hypothetical protein BpHYR1_024841 [Brachionus plicatilis]|uniref:Uncharacterized protein n=1 Tax=Brachionus plicatilis TaxID=10195 RepID=A0A3M7PJY1_BRAPC|nr:hypothetical protein BpHYR1_024841 [Brachionus plicatilis]